MVEGQSEVVQCNREVWTAGSVQGPVAYCLTEEDRGEVGLIEG